MLVKTFENRAIPQQLLSRHGQIKQDYGVKSGKRDPQLQQKCLFLLHILCERKIRWACQGPCFSTPALLPWPSPVAPQVTTVFLGNYSLIGPLSGCITRLLIKVTMPCFYCKSANAYAMYLCFTALFYQSVRSKTSRGLRAGLRM